MQTLVEIEAALEFGIRMIGYCFKCAWRNRRSIAASSRVTCYVDIHCDVPVN